MKTNICQREAAAWLLCMQTYCKCGSWLKLVILSHCPNSYGKVNSGRNTKRCLIQISKDWNSKGVNGLNKGNYEPRWKKKSVLLCRKSFSKNLIMNIRLLFYFPTSNSQSSLAKNSKGIIFSLNTKWYFYKFNALISEIYLVDNLYSYGLLYRAELKICDRIFMGEPRFGSFTHQCK